MFPNKKFNNTEFIVIYCNYITFNRISKESKYLDLKSEPRFCISKNGYPNVEAVHDFEVHDSKTFITGIQTCCGLTPPCHFIFYSLLSDSDIQNPDFGFLIPMYLDLRYHKNGLWIILNVK